MLKRTRFGLALTLLVLVSMIITACAGVAPASTTTGGETGDEASANQILRLVWEGGIARGPIPGLDGGPAGMGINVYMPLVIGDEQGNLHPGLAESWESNEDNTVWTYHINPNARWSDGKPVTAQDFVDWWNFVFHPDFREGWTPTYVFGPVLGMDEFGRGEADHIEGFVAIDDQTLQITLVRSEGWFPLRTSWQWSAPARVEQYKDLDYSAAATNRDRWGVMSTVWLGEGCRNLITTGPFKCDFMEPEPGAVYKWVRNDDWWGAYKPILTRIEGTTLRDFQTMLLVFENGEVDAALQLSGPPAVLLRQSQPEVFVQRPSYAYAAQFIDTTKSPTDDVLLRKALLHAIDWASVSTVAWEGEMLPVTGGSPLPPTMPCYDADYAPYAFDPDLAKELLAQSNYGDPASGEKIRILTAGSDPPRIRAAQIIQEMWRVNLGIENVEIKNAESEFVDGQGLVNMRVSSGGAPLPIPGLLLESLGHSRANAAQTVTFWSDPEVDQMIDDVLAMSTDDPAYCEAFYEAFDRVMDAAVVIPTTYYRSFIQVQPWTRNFEWGISGLIFDDTFLARR